jgi:hypothetical protein
MSKLARIASVVLLTAVCGTRMLAAQSGASGNYRWYIGPQAGVIIFETPNQTKGASLLAGAHMLVTAKRTALMLSVEEGFARNQLTSYSDKTAPGGVRNVLFNDIRKYTASVLFFPLKTAAQPYFGLGFGILHTVTEYPQNTVTQAELDSAVIVSNSLGSSGFGSAVGGVQFRSNRLSIFAQYQITTSPHSGKLLTGPTHSFVGGIRLGLGPAREGVSGGGY